jgi:hypothetical protein
MIIILILLVILFICYINREKFEDLNEKLPKNIFTYLFDDSSLNIKNNIENLKLSIPEHWNLIIINEENMNKYVEEKFILKHKDLEVERFMNLIGIKLILKYGGIWIDPRINVTDGSQFDRYQTESIYQGYDCSILEFKDHKYIKYLKSYMIMATKNSIFLKNLLDNLSKFYYLDSEEFIEKHIPKNIKIKRKPTKERVAKFIQYFAIYLLLLDGYKYQLLKRKEKNKKFYGIKITKTNNRDILNQEIEKYVFKFI